MDLFPSRAIRHDQFRAPVYHNRPGVGVTSINAKTDARIALQVAIFGTCDEDADVNTALLVQVPNRTELRRPVTAIGAHDSMSARLIRGF